MIKISSMDFSEWTQCLLTDPSHTTQLTKLLRKNNDYLDKRSIEKKIIRSRELAVVQAMDELNRVMAISVKVRKQTIWVRTDIPN